MDTAGVILTANLAMARQIGYPVEELVGRSLSDLLAPEAQSDFPGLTALARQGESQGFLRIRTRSGEERVLEYVNRLVERPGASPVIRAIAHDVQRRWAEQALRLSLGRLEAILNNIPDLAWLKDEQGRYISVNAAFAAFVGRPRTEIVGKLDADLFPSALAAALRYEDRRVLRSGRSISSNDELPAADGRIVSFEAIRTPLVEGVALPSGTTGIARDVTERRRMEDELLQAQKMEALGRLAGGIAHDFNNLLTMILGYCDLLHAAADTTVREDIEQVRRAGERGAALTRQLLAFSRKQVVEPKILDLNAVVSDSSKMLERLLGETIEIRVELDPAAGRIRADVTQMEQVLVNLALNARDAMPDGGRLLIQTHRVEQAELSRSGEGGPWALLTVIDSGTGFESESLRHLFEPFYTTKGPGKGTGLGLATVYGIVKQNGGEIVVDSDRGRGSAFRVYLPRIDLPADDPSSTAGPRVPAAPRQSCSSKTSRGCGTSSRGSSGRRVTGSFRPGRPRTLSGRREGSAMPSTFS